MWLRGEGSSYRTVEMQWEKQTQPGHTLKGISTREGLFASPKEWEDTIFYILLSTISPCTSQMAAQGKEMKFSYKHLILGAVAFKENC